jgi:hypothetical protein
VERGNGLVGNLHDDLVEVKAPTFADGLPRVPPTRGAPETGKIASVFALRRAGI